MFIKKWVINGLIKKLLEKAKDRYHNSGVKEKAAEYYLKDWEVLKQKARNKYRKFCEEEKETKKEYRKNRFKTWKKIQAKRMLKKWKINFL